MSSKQITEAEQEQLKFACQFCGVAPGVWCTTRSGRGTGFLHSDRYYQWIDSTFRSPKREPLKFQDRPADPAEYLPPRPTDQT